MRNSMRYAYKIEGHAIAVSQYQSQKKLYEVRCLVDSVKHVEEADLGWWVINVNTGPIVLYDGECTNHIAELKRGNLIKVIQTYEARSDLFFGSLKCCIGCVHDYDHRDRLLYKSIGYNIDNF